MAAWILVIKTVQSSGFKVRGSGFKVQSSKFRVQNSKFRVQGSKFKVQGSKFRVQGSRLLISCSKPELLPFSGSPAPEHPGLGRQLTTHSSWLIRD
jgi:hypothetical protein